MWVDLRVFLFVPLTKGDFEHENLKHVEFKM